MLRQCLLRSVPYLWAAASVALALDARLLLNPWLGDNRPFLTFLAAIAIAAWIGGRSVALFAIVLSYLVANYFFIPPLAQIDFDHQNSADWTNILVFGSIALFVVEPILVTQRALRAAEASAAEVERLLAEAKEVAEQKDRFLAALAHELRNPLTAIGCGLHLWPQVVDDVAEMDRLRTLMTRQARMISRLVDDMMDMVRFDRGVMRLQKEPLDMAALVRDVVASIGQNAEKRGHKLLVDLPPDRVEVEGDAVRLNQVLLNILDNAIKYTDRDGVISITARREQDNAVVQIRDNGPGISESMLPSIFEMFSQDQSTLGRSAGGLGIGLCLVKQLVALHGGTVVARSEGLGKGSEFVVTLPALPSRLWNIDAIPSPKRQSLPAAHRILVVDDVRDSAETLAKILCSMDQEATSLYDGATAVEWMLTHQPDVVFLDIAMPGLDGYEVVRRVREHHELSSTVLVALTAFGQQADRRRALKAGFAFHLTKPADIVAIEDLLLNLPRRGQAVADAAKS